MSKYLNMEHSANDSQSILRVLVLFIQIEPVFQTKYEVIETKHDFN